MSRYVKMNPHVKRKWVAALRSGEYRQGRKQLFTDDNRRCCMGVLVEEMAPEFCKDGPDEFGVKKVMTSSVSYYVNDTIPDDLSTTWGLDPDAVDVLINKNDSSRWSFKRIATWIEKNL